MLRHREKVLAHAEKQLAAKGKQNSAELLQLYKRFLKIENHRLQLRHYAGGGGREIAQQRANLVDIVLRHLFASSTGVSSRNPELAGFSLVAIGGYGRGELNPFSDVDIMFLHGSDKGKEEQLNKIVEQVLYMLWDIGFKVGHSTRTVDAAIEQANADMLSKTSLLEARFVAGDRALFEKFKTSFDKKCVRSHVAEYVEDRKKNQADRHAKFGSTVYMQEPNIKNGCGGMRDYQNLLWIAYFKEGVQSTSKLVERKRLSESERRKLELAYDFLLRVRTELHYLNKRPLDVLTLPFQMQIANKFQYPEKNPLRRSEAFMRDYYQHARNIFYITHLLSQRMSLGKIAQAPKRGFFGLLPKRKVKREEFDGFYTDGEALYPMARDIFGHDVFRMMRLFQHAQVRHLVLSPELQHLLRRRLHLVDRTFQYSRTARETFKAILSRKGDVGRILRMMHEVDFLGRYLPEFGQLTCLVQHEFFHRYTADEHTLVCIEKLDQLLDTEDPKLGDYSKLFQKLEDPFVLYLSLILHDTGKAANARHHAEASAICAQRVAARLQLTSDQRRSLILLVDHHMTLSSSAQRRNLEDPATVAEFAGIVKHQLNLNMLMLMTLVDGQGTGDDNWSDWKESLVWQLYRSSSQYLADGPALFKQRKIERDATMENVAKRMSRDFQEEINAHFQYMPETYFQTNSIGDIVGHIRLFRNFLEKRSADDAMALAPAVKWIEHPEKGHSEVWICTWDRAALFARIAGSFAVAHMNILSADIFTRGDSIVLDIFRICDTQFQAVSDEKDIALVEKYLRESLQEEDYDFTPLLQKSKRKKAHQLAQELDFPTRINIQNDVHPIYTLVDIQTPDRLGLLYNLLKAFASADVNIVLSRIATEKGAAIDTFYVTDAIGQKIESTAAIKALQQVLLDAAMRASQTQS